MFLCVMVSAYVVLNFYERYFIFVTLQDENETRLITEEYESSSTTKNRSVNIKENIIATTWKDGPYLLVVKIVPSKQDANWNLTGEVWL